MSDRVPGRRELCICIHCQDESAVGAEDVSEGVELRLQYEAVLLWGEVRCAHLYFRVRREVDVYVDPIGGGKSDAGDAVLVLAVYDNS